MNDRDFWIDVRRGFVTVITAVERQQRADPSPLWSEIHGGLRTIINAIEYRWRLPHASRLVIGSRAGLDSEPPPEALARSSKERVE